MTEKYVRFFLQSQADDMNFAMLSFNGDSMAFATIDQARLREGEVKVQHETHFVSVHRGAKANPDANVPSSLQGPQCTKLDECAEVAPWCREFLVAPLRPDIGWQACALEKKTGAWWLVEGFNGDSVVRLGPEAPPVGFAQTLRATNRKWSVFKRQNVTVSRSAAKQ